jgi:hypothetical protein
MRKKTILFSWAGLLTALFPLMIRGQSESASGYLTSLPPEAPTLGRPADQSSVSAEGTTLAWHRRIHTANYTLQVSATPDFSDLFAGRTVADTVMDLVFLDPNTTYYWRVSGSNVAGEGKFSEVRVFITAPLSAPSAPPGYGLQSAYPNPFCSTTTFICHLPDHAEISLIILDSRGQVVRRLMPDHLNKGGNAIRWDGRDDQGFKVDSGLYFCLLRSGSLHFTQKVLFIH